eukprot:SAG11_NODE_4894_length_1731_cov_3.501838_3_plen_83_part_00
MTGASCSPGAAARAAGPLPAEHGGYEDALFETDVMNAIEAHHARQAAVEAAAAPLFVFWAPHIAHSPLQVNCDQGCSGCAQT